MKKLARNGSVGVELLNSAVTIQPINRLIDKAAIFFFNRIEISPSINRSSRVFCVNHTCKSRKERH